MSGAVTEDSSQVNDLLHRAAGGDQEALRTCSINTTIGSRGWCTYA